RRGCRPGSAQPGQSRSGQQVRDHPFDGAPPSRNGTLRSVLSRDLKAVAMRGPRHSWFRGPRCESSEPMEGGRHRDIEPRGDTGWVACWPVQPAAQRRARDAAMATASALGLAVDDAVVLNDSNRLVVRLMPSDVVARVVPLGYRVFAAAVGAEREVEVLRNLAVANAPVAALEPRVEPRVFVRDGFEIELLHYYEPVPTRALRP